MISFSASVFAATVNSTGGQVLINRGDGYKQVAGSTQGNPGDTVVANPGGSGTIVYPDGCVVDVMPGTVVTIAAQSPCTAGTGTGINATTFALGAVVVGGGVGAAILLGQDKSASP
jgi:hypothetical protein